MALEDEQSKQAALVYIRTCCFTLWLACMLLIMLFNYYDIYLYTCVIVHKTCSDRLNIYLRYFYSIYIFHLSAIRPPVDNAISCAH